MLAADDLECAICLCEYTQEDELSCLPCQHYYHTECLRLHHQDTCPVCRQPISLATQDLHRVNTVETV
jgi:hypothetical protein